MGRRDAAPYRDSTLCVLFLFFLQKQKEQKSHAFQRVA